MVSDIMTRETGMWNKEALLKHLPHLISRLRVNLPPVGSPTNLFPWIAWTIWTARNLLIFENRTINPATCMTRAISAAKEWAIAQTLSPPPLSRPFGQFPLASNEPNPMVFCYTDASWIASTKHAGLAWIFTDRAKKELNRGSHFRNLISSPLLAESLAIRASLLHASALGYTNIWIHSDSQKLVRALWTDVGHHSFLRVPCSSSASHGWRGIIAGRDVIIQHLGKMIGNGNSTKLWHEPWLSVSTPTSISGPVTIDEKDLMVSDIMTRETRMWNKEALLKHLPHLVEDILLIQPSSTGAEDGYAWLLNPSGEYSSKSGYLALHLKDSSATRNNNLPDDFNWYKSVWSPQLLPKIQIFLWKISRLRVNLPPVGIPTNLFPWIAWTIWTARNLLIFENRTINPATCMTRAISAAKEWAIAQTLSPPLFSRLRVNLPPVGSPTNLFPWIAWTIWTARNLLIFENRTINPATCITRAISAAKEWAIAQTLSPLPVSRPLGQLPLASNEPNSTIFCYTDASWIASTKHAGLAWIFTDRAKKELN
ncbi:hypothetical protein DY000_02063340 [Brassica cretica]|uniref:RNase H type-1 domain-containing protein n=1 Tax=Brassica cretica TaxID=69181 RepID=A0ABQ7ATJ8_BRACR|nr:hypothetical protein DY000_02063340 [Brassica cretica]